MSQYIQLGTSGSFVAPASGQLTLLCNDSQASDNTGSITVNIAGTNYVVPATAGPSSDSGVPGPTLVANQTYAYSVTGQQTWSINASETSVFDASGNPAAGNSSTPFDYTVARPNAELGLIEFSLIGRLDTPAVAVSNSSHHLFSTGILTYTYNGVVYTVAYIQSIDFDAAFESKMLHDAVINGRFPSDIGFGDGSFTIKVTNSDLDFNNLQMLAAAQIQAQSSAGFPGTGIEAILDGKLDLPGCALSFQGQATSGKLMMLTASNVFAKGFSWPLRRDDWTNQAFELTCVADSNGVVATPMLQQ